VQALEADPSCKSVENRVKKFIEYTGACRATYFNLKRELKDSNQLDAFEKVEVPNRQLHGQPPTEPNVEAEVARAKEEDEARKHKSDDNPSTTGPANGALPSGQQYSNDPNDYNSFSDYVDDWWKRPRPSEEDEEQQTEPRAEDFGTDAEAPLRRELKEAIEREDYKRASQLRDAIRRIEEKRE
jgi:hypothetical protein